MSMDDFEASEIDSERAFMEHEITTALIVDQFLESEIGHYIVQRAEVARAQALEDLVRCNPDDPVSVRRAQNEVRIIDQIQQWLADALRAGASASESMRQMDTE